MESSLVLWLMLIATLAIIHSVQAQDQQGILFYLYYKRFSSQMNCFYGKFFNIQQDLSVWIVGYLRTNSLLITTLPRG